MGGVGERIAAGLCSLKVRIICMIVSLEQGKKEDQDPTSETTYFGSSSFVGQIRR
jgi:hypothetical protein